MPENTVDSPRIGILVVAYNAATTLEPTLDRIPASFARRLTDVLVCDDASVDETYSVGVKDKSTSTLPLTVIKHRRNRGYGGNPGKPSEEGLAADADAAVTTLRDLGYPPRRVLYFGESLGSGVVAALQARHPPAGIVLRSPFTELADVGAHHYPWLPVRLLLRDRFPVEAHVAAGDVPVTVVYGDRDSVVPAELSARVADRARVLAERVVIPGADHNDPVMFGPPVVDAVARLG